MAISQEFRNRIGVVTLSLTKFVDRNGVWAKAPETVANLEYEFVDGHSGSMTYDEYRTLTREQKLLIQRAPSSPAV